MVQPKYGAAFKRLRQAHACQQRALANDRADLQALSRFERGQHAITLDRLGHLLDRIPATYQEYLHALTPAPDANFDDFMAMRGRLLFAPAGKQRRRMLATRYRMRYDATGEEWLEHRALILAAPQNGERRKAERQRLRDYLQHRQVWSHYEFTLFTHGLTTVLNLDDVPPLWHQLRQPFDAGTRLGYQNQRRQIDALLMVAQLALEAMRLNLADQALKLADTLPALSGGGYEELRLRGLQAMYMVRHPDQSTRAGQERLRALADLSDFLGDTALAERLRVAVTEMVATNSAQRAR